MADLHASKGVARNAKVCRPFDIEGLLQPKPLELQSKNRDSTLPSTALAKMAITRSLELMRQVTVTESAALQFPLRG